MRCFERVAAVLEPGGSSVLECFVPDLGRYDQGQSLPVVHLDDETVRIDASRHDPVAQRVRSGVVHLGDASLRVRPIQLRYAWPAELDLMTRIAGLRPAGRFGGWSGERFDASCRSHVSVYRRH